MLVNLTPKLTYFALLTLQCPVDLFTHLIVGHSVVFFQWFAGSLFLTVPIHLGLFSPPVVDLIFLCLLVLRKYFNEHCYCLQCLL
jgi:hypothetical protein